MPSAKADKSLIKSAVKERYGWARPGEIFEAIQSAGLLAFADGCITIPKAEQLRSTLVNRAPHNFFPYSTLRTALTNALLPNAWSPDIERDLLIFLSIVFGESDPDCFTYADLAQERLPTLGCIYEQLFDLPPDDFSLEGKLCDFTGAFIGKSRRECHEVVIASGGIPSDSGWYTDCFFVADDHYDQRVISNGFAAAITARTRFGVTRIYRERHFK
ncbi:MAG: hypothetical protein OZ926_14770 [Pseudomonas sp.]|nr:hypothetical protein [Pseudomonas sp.]